jgi:hypothetical protein
MGAPESTTDGSPLAGRLAGANVAEPTRSGARMSTTAIARSLLAGVALAVALPPTGRLATEILSPRVSANLQALCAGSRAAAVDLGSALCLSMTRPRAAVLARR